MRSSGLSRSVKKERGFDIALSPERRVETVAESVAEAVCAEDETEDSERDEKAFPPDTLPETDSGIIEHDAPGRFVLRAEAEEREEYLGGNGGGEAKRELDNHQMHHIGQDMSEKDSGRGIAEDFSGKDIAAVGVFESFRADRPVDADPSRATDSEIDAEEPLSGDQGDCEDQQNGGDGSDGCRQAGADRIDFSPKIPGGETEKGTERNGDQRRNDADMECDSGTLEEAAKDIATEVVGTEQEKMLRTVPCDGTGKRGAVSEVKVDLVVARHPVVTLSVQASEFRKNSRKEVDAEHDDRPFRKVAAAGGVIGLFEGAGEHQS